MFYDTFFTRQAVAPRDERVDPSVILGNILVQVVQNAHNPLDRWTVFIHNAYVKLKHSEDKL